MVKEHQETAPVLLGGGENVRDSLEQTTSWGAAMARLALSPSPASLDDRDVPSFEDDLVRPALQKAFSLPDVDQAKDELFSRLLDALAKRSGGPCR